MTEQTIAEQLDAAQSGEEFGSILNTFITALGNAEEE